MNLVGYVMNHQYSAGGVVRKAHAIDWESYEIWQEHCPHNLTLEWDRRCAVKLHERIRERELRLTVGQIAYRFGGQRWRKLAAEIAGALYPKQETYNIDQANVVLETMKNAMEEKNHGN